MADTAAKTAAPAPAAKAAEAKVETPKVAPKRTFAIKDNAEENFPTATRNRAATSQPDPDLVEAIKATHKANQYAVYEGVEAAELKKLVFEIRRAADSLAKQGVGASIRITNAEGKLVKVPGSTGPQPNAEGLCNLAFKGKDRRGSGSSDSK